MRLIGVASIIFIITLVFATSTSGPAATALERTQRAVGESERRHPKSARTLPTPCGAQPANIATTPLRALRQHAPYFHDGSAAELLAVVNHYNQLFDLNLSETQKADLVQYLKSL
jgi:cytochrome c peroxidase